MKILLVHQNYPAQFLHLAPELTRLGHEVRVLTNSKNQNQFDQAVIRYNYTSQKVDAAATRLGRNYTLMSDRGVVVARAARALRHREGYVPDVIFGHSGWGETLFLKEVWPEAKLLIYAEFYYKGIGADVGFDPEFGAAGFDQIMIAQGRAAYLGQALLHADAAVAPTNWQTSTHPPLLRNMLEVIFDGINTEVMKPDAKASMSLPGGRVIKAGDEILTFVNRNLEPYRGYHIFMRSLPEIMSARPNARVIIMGGDEVSYGAPPKPGTTWKETFLSEVRDRIDLNRVHFLGKVPYPDFVSLMQISRAHAYLTYPFVLSWSMLEAMSAGALVIGSKTAPVEEVIQDGVNGKLVGFHDVAGWSAALIDALAHPDRYVNLRRAARETVLQHYDLKRLCLPKMVAKVTGLGAASTSSSKQTAG